MARILLGVTGGIAAYKAVELVRLATAAGHSVRVVQTPVSERFVGRATFAAVTGAPVLVDEFEPDPARGAFPGDPAESRAPISHLELVSRADAFAVAPASANTIAKLAVGQADNLLTSAALANRAPLIIAPAMNDRMWSHPATEANTETLRHRGATIVEPATGRLASEGEWGAGRLADPARILQAIEESIGPTTGPLDGARVLVTAGGTREPIDSVRYLGNRSSGRMGLALARACASAGAQVSLIAANVALELPSGLHESCAVQTAADLEAAVGERFPSTDVLLMAAAVADFRPVTRLEAKLDKSAAVDGLALSLEPTADVLAGLVAARAAGQVIVGFAAEHGPEGIERARGKLRRKQLDAIVVNDISRSDIGFDSPDNEVTFVTGQQTEPIPLATKDSVARAIVERLPALVARRADGLPS